MPQQNGEKIEDQGLHLDLPSGETKRAGILAKFEVAEAIESHRLQFL
ncbi:MULTISPECIES: hypothetical protein [unclassified Mesorhizobium]|nr:MULTISPECIES: hypothetical protein [unclassified Mesorhizobium]